MCSGSGYYTYAAAKRDSGDPLIERRRSRGRSGGESVAETVFDLAAEDLAAFARRLARRGVRVGGDPVEVERAWGAVAFQAEGVADVLSQGDACTLLRELSAAGMLAKHPGALRALLSVLRHGGATELKTRKVIGVWSALDRNDVGLDDDEAIAFFCEALPRALPVAALLPGEAHPSAAWHVDVAASVSASAPAADEEEVASRPKGTHHDWRRVFALLSASGCAQEALRRAWTDIEAAMLSDRGRVRALPMQGLVYALRAAALAMLQMDAKPSTEFVHSLCSRSAEQAQWMDGWAASHVALAAASLGITPAKAYDPLRTALLERCSLEPRVLGGSAALVGAAGAGIPVVRGSGLSVATSVELIGLAEAERVAAALARFDVHDAEVRSRLSSWLLLPGLPPKRLAGLARSLAAAGLGDAVAPKVAKHVRARLRSSEMLAAVGAEVVDGLSHLYARAD